MAIDINAMIRKLEEIDRASENDRVIWWPHFAVSISIILIITLIINFRINFPEEYHYSRISLSLS